MSDFANFDISMLYGSQGGARSAVSSEDWRDVLDPVFKTISKTGKMVILAKIALGAYTIGQGPQAFSWAKDDGEEDNLSNYFEFKKFERGSRPDNAAALENLTLTRFIRAYVPMTVGFITQYYGLDLKQKSKDQIPKEVAQWAPLAAFCKCEGRAKLLYVFGFPHAEMLLYEPPDDMNSSWLAIIQTSVYLSNTSLMQRSDVNANMKDIARNKMLRLVSNSMLQSDLVIKGLETGVIKMHPKKVDKKVELTPVQRKMIEGKLGKTAPNAVDLDSI